MKRVRITESQETIKEEPCEKEANIKENNTKPETLNDANNTKDTATNEKKQEEGEDPLEHAPLIVVLWYLSKNLTLRFIYWVLGLPLWKAVLYFAIWCSITGSIYWFLSWLLQDVGIYKLDTPPPLPNNCQGR